MSRFVALVVLVALFALAYGAPQPQLILSDGLGLASPLGLSSWSGLSPLGVSPLGLSSWNGLSPIGLSSLGGIQTLGAGTVLLKK